MTICAQEVLAIGPQARREQFDLGAVVRRRFANIRSKIKALRYDWLLGDVTFSLTEEDLTESLYDRSGSHFGSSCELDGLYFGRHRIF